MNGLLSPKLLDVDIFGRQYGNGNQESLLTIGNESGYCHLIAITPDHQAGVANMLMRCYAPYNKVAG